MVEPYNPLDKNNLGESVADALLRANPEPLGKLNSFVGAGIYAIYYFGKFVPYSLIANENKEDRFNLPIYVGKAVPPGARKGSAHLGDDPSTAMFARLREHGKSIEESNNLGLEDFFCRYLVIDDIWIPLGESLLIAKFSPLWNQFLDGFGNHDPGSGRYNQFRSRWDTFHSGRSWALKCRERPETAKQIGSEVKAFLRDQLS